MTTAVSGTRTFALTVNGKACQVQAAPHHTLLDTLRDDLGLTGSKKGCNEGECASCTVLVDDVPVNSCLVLIGDAADKSVVTVEGIANGEPHPVQKAFVELGGVQCGYCTPGMVVSACALLAEHPDPSDEDIKFYLAGNICRCTGYNKITAAVRRAAADLRARHVSAGVRSVP
jgi:aerobic-type carbon monoxide dehydrogenase small subunit (CoxS/CutS family)